MNVSLDTSDSTIESISHMKEISFDPMLGKNRMIFRLVFYNDMSSKYRQVKC